MLISINYCFSWGVQTMTTFDHVTVVILHIFADIFSALVVEVLHDSSSETLFECSYEIWWNLQISDKIKECFQRKSSFSWRQNMALSRIGEIVFDRIWWQKRLIGWLKHPFRNRARFCRHNLELSRTDLLEIVKYFGMILQSQNHKPRRSSG